jgi:sulfur-oxidizing protein SoxX
LRNAALLALLLATAATAQPLIIDDGIPAPLSAAPGDAQRGRAIVASRQRGLCLLCHSGPFPEERFQGDLAPSLAGAGARLTVAQLRLRMVDSRKLNPETIMPAYFSTEGLVQVGAAFQGRTLLSAEEIEDVIAYLATLRE